LQGGWYFQGLNISSVSDVNRGDKKIKYSKVGCSPLDFPLADNTADEWWWVRASCIPNLCQVASLLLRHVAVGEDKEDCGY